MSKDGEDMQSRSSQPEAIATTESEAYQTLLARAHRRTGGVPTEMIVRHVLSVTRGGDWPVYRDALFAWRDTNVSVDYSQVSCPVAERAAYKESVWLPHHIFLGPKEDVDDIAAAIEKVTAAFRAGASK